VLVVDRRWVDQGENSFWALCVDYLDSSGGAGPTGKDGAARNRIDYREKLDLGCRVFPRYTILNRRSRVRFRRKLRALEVSYLGGGIDELALQQRSARLIAFTRTRRLSSWRFRQSVLESRLVSDRMAGREPGDPGRELEQRPAERAVGVPEQEQAGEPEQQPGLPSGPSSTGAVDSALD
jgi:hypothetical protein